MYNHHKRPPCSGIRSEAFLKPTLSNCLPSDYDQSRHGAQFEEMYLTQKNSVQKSGPVEKNKSQIDTFPETNIALKISLAKRKGGSIASGVENKHLGNCNCFIYLLVGGFFSNPVQKEYCAVVKLDQVHQFFGVHVLNKNS